MNRVLNNARNISIPEDIQMKILKECEKYKLETGFSDDDIMYIGKNFFTDLIDIKKIVIYLLGTLNNDTIMLNCIIDLLYDDKEVVDFSIGSLLKYNQENRRNHLCLNCYMCEDCIRCNRCIFSKDCSDSSLCYGCINCKNCSDCHTCTQCTACKNCTGCDDCINCEECINYEECCYTKGYRTCLINGMTKCCDFKKCVNCKTNCNNCIECTNCNNCTDCIGCINCTDCDNCDHIINKVGSKNVNYIGFISLKSM